MRHDLQRGKHESVFVPGCYQYQCEYSGKVATVVFKLINTHNETHVSGFEERLINSPRSCMLDFLSHRLTSVWLTHVQLRPPAKAHRLWLTRQFSHAPPMMCSDFCSQAAIDKRRKHIGASPQAAIMASLNPCCSSRCSVQAHSRCDCL